jgi:hypothetical protein
VIRRLIRISVIPFDKQSDSLIHLDVSAFETLAFAFAVAENDHMQLRSGMIAFLKDTPAAHGALRASEAWGAERREPLHFVDTALPSSVG